MPPRGIFWGFLISGFEGLSDAKLLRDRCINSFCLSLQRLWDRRAAFKRWPHVSRRGASSRQCSLCEPLQPRRCRKCQLSFIHVRERAAGKPSIASVITHNGYNSDTVNKAGIFGAARWYFTEGSTEETFTHKRPCPPLWALIKANIAHSFIAF